MTDKKLKPWHKKARDLRKQGKTIAQIAEKMNRAESTVYAVVQDIESTIKSKPRGAAPSLGGEDLAQATKRRKQGASYAELAREFGLSRQRMHQLLKDVPCKHPPKVGRPAAEV